MLQWLKAKEAVLLHAAVGVGEGCCALRWSCKLQWAQAKDPALRHMLRRGHRRSRLRCDPCCGGVAGE
jgi:hypothetical protein